MGVVVLICLSMEVFILLFHDSNFFTASIIVMAIQWLAGLGFRAGDTEGAAKVGGALGLAAMIVCLMSLRSRDVGAFIAICGINFVASLVWGCSGEEDSGANAPVNSNHRSHGNEIWEIKKVRRIRRK